MYVYKQAFAKPARFPLTWESADLEHKTLNEIRNEYREAMLDCEESFTQRRYLINVNDLADANNLGITVADALVKNGDKVLSNVLGPGELHRASVSYTHLFKTDVVTDIVNKDATYQDPEYSMNYYLRAKFTRASATEVYENYLVTINGFFHPTFKDENYFYVGDAVKSPILSGEHMAGLHHFGALGKLDVVPITDDMIEDRDGEPLENMTLIKIDRDITDKTVMLSLGGILHVMDPEVWTRFGEKHMRVIWTQIDMHRRVFDARDFIDVTPLFKEGRDLTGPFYREELYSNEVLRAYLTLPQSFLIYVDSPSISLAHIPAESGPYENQYYSNVPRNFALKAETGVMLDYFSQRCESDVKTNYLTQRYRFNNYLYETSNIDETTVGTDARIPAWPKQPFRKPRAYFAEYFSVKLVVRNEKGAVVTTFK